MLNTKQVAAVAAVTPDFRPKAVQLAQQLGLPVTKVNDDQPQLRISHNGVAVAIPGLGNPVAIDFSSGKYDHRRKFGGGRGQPLAKAVGLKQGHTPTVIDATAGFARDAFVLASLGCHVMMLEQHRIMSLLIDEALQQSASNPTIADIISRMHILHGNAIQLLEQGNIVADVIYMDPMYPSREKSALVKKEMQLLHQLVGSDIDSHELLSIARTIAIKRVVVKRPKGAEYVGAQKPSASIESKNTRFDIYAC